MEPKVRWPRCSLVLLLALLCGCGASTEQPDVRELARDNAAFALDLCQRLGKPEQNLFFSPYSISSALAMVHAGARGNTERQIATTLHYSLPQEQLHPAFARTAVLLAEARDAGGLHLDVASSLWPRRDYPFLDGYLALLEKHYRASIQALDYAQAPEDARQQINAWVEGKTRNRITELIPPAIISPDTRMVLVNAIYFKAQWESRFKGTDTRDAPFHITADRAVQAPMMTQALVCRYATHALLDIVELPYAGATIAMIVLLPGKVDGIRALEDSLTIESLDRWLAPLSEQEVVVTLPRFSMASTIRLDDALQSMGMVDAFSEATADFAGMNGGAGPLYLSAVLHKAFVEVNEEGTRAAAGTAVAQTWGVDALKQRTFRADHPFLFLIRETSTGSILFMGRLCDPTQGMAAGIEGAARPR